MRGKYKISWCNVQTEHNLFRKINNRISRDETPNAQDSTPVNKLQIKSCNDGVEYQNLRGDNRNKRRNSLRSRQYFLYSNEGIEERVNS